MMPARQNEACHVQRSYPAVEIYLEIYLEIDDNIAHSPSSTYAWQLTTVKTGSYNFESSRSEKNGRLQEAILVYSKFT